MQQAYDTRRCDYGKAQPWVASRFAVGQTLRQRRSNWRRLAFKIDRERARAGSQSYLPWPTAHSRACCILSWRLLHGAWAQCPQLQHSTACCNTVRPAATQYGLLQHSTTCCNTVRLAQHNTTCFNTVPPVATQYGLLQHSTGCCNTVRVAATQYGLLQHSAPSCNTVRLVATHYGLLQHGTACCNTVPPVATHYGLLQHGTACCNTVHVQRSTIVRHAAGARHGVVPAHALRWCAAEPLVSLP
jgi:hypothetical protein